MISDSIQEITTVAKLNRSPLKYGATTSVKTHEGGPAVTLSPLQELRRALLATMLWENTFYESGKSIAQRITELVTKVPVADVLKLAVEARTKYKLRHAPLWLLNGILRAGGIKGKAVGGAIADVIQRPDEMTELLAMYWEGGKRPLAKQLKRGLAIAFGKFSAYQLAKYNRNEAIKLRDVMFLCHPKPKNEQQAAEWKQLVDGTLPSPETWENKLSRGEDKGESFALLLREKKLGYMALLKNLRNMVETGVDRELIKQRLLEGAPTSKALPFRFLTAAKYAPSLESTLDEAMELALSGFEKLEGTTAILVDVSGSMGDKVSDKSELTRAEAGCALANLLRFASKDCRIFSFSDKVVEVPVRKGKALQEVIMKSQHMGGTYTGNAITAVNQAMKYDRIVVITDEQSHDSIPHPNGKGYILNIGGYRNGIAYGPWVQVTGFSEAAVEYIREYEQQFYKEGAR
jgi:60 kDa SS-A/Ro ribonucleoprotein